MIKLTEGDTGAAPLAISDLLSLQARSKPLMEANTHSPPSETTQVEYPEAPCHLA
jgi:hypothetical protein